ncbi:MAG: hypothetical protein HC836_14530 [Richelia sp. RM2_1_2]|nr:hypothetical protein [Richelia sp. SM1_7_0]NJN07737.1 hypothetical protein [Richelia sp. RM1_1_1]NJO27312.1 hypothetical protein [Richelia sp. SL_2_1]NJO59467.1 hypothetical protein [Richelia sp. RM2_1_2]
MNNIRKSLKNPTSYPNFCEAVLTLDYQMNLQKLGWYRHELRSPSIYVSTVTFDSHLSSILKILTCSTEIET